MSDPLDEAKAHASNIDKTVERAFRALDKTSMDDEARNRHKLLLNAVTVLTSAVKRMKLED